MGVYCKNDMQYLRTLYGLYADVLMLNLGTLSLKPETK